MRFIIGVVKFVFSLYGFIIFLLFFFLLLPFFTVAFFQKPVRSGNMVIKIARVWSDLFFFFTFIKPQIIYEEIPDSAKEYLFVSNHISYIDIPMMLATIRKRNLRILGKAEMNKIPLFGQVYKRGAVTVNRENPVARAKSIEKMIKLINKKVSVFICPEGTFNTTGEPLKRFYDGAFKIAIETQKPVLPVIFLDTYQRLNYKSIFSLTPGKCRAVYLPEITTTGLTLQNMEELKQQVYKMMEAALFKFEASWIVSDKSNRHD